MFTSKFFCCRFIVKLCLTHCSPMDCSIPGFPVLCYLPEFAQIHVCWVSDAIWPSHPLLSLSPFASVSISIFSIESQLFASSGQSFEASASVPVFPMNIQGWFLLGLTGLISMQSKGPSRVFSSTTVQRHQFFGTQPSLWSKSHICTWLLEKP